MITGMFTALGIFALVAFGFAVHDGQAWCERRYQRRHRED